MIAKLNLLLPVVLISAGGTYAITAISSSFHHTSEGQPTSNHSEKTYENRSPSDNKSVSDRLITVCKSTKNGEVILYSLFKRDTTTNLWTRSTWTKNQQNDTSELTREFELKESDLQWKDISKIFQESECKGAATIDVPEITPTDKYIIFKLSSPDIGICTKNNCSIDSWSTTEVPMSGTEPKDSKLLNITGVVRTQTDTEGDFKISIWHSNSIDILGCGKSENSWSLEWAGCEVKNVGVSS